MDRIALIIGNSEYKYVGKLKNPKNDANDIAHILKSLGFKVKHYLDLDIVKMESVIRNFLMELDEYSTGLFFFAGHGMQINGVNYLVPIDCELKDKTRTILSCFDVNKYLEGVSNYKGKTNICILDACRNNPFERSNRDILCGFTPFLSQPKGTIIAYSTSLDDVASDGEGSNGLYTGVLKDALQIPNIKIEEMFKSVRKKVMELSNDEQITWEHSSLIGDFYFSVKDLSVVPDVDDMRIYDYIQERINYYSEVTEDINDIECMPYVDAYNNFKIPIIKIVRAYTRVTYKKNGNVFTDSTIDQINIGYLESWGFKRKNGRWYYNDKYVELGDPLPLSDELLQLEPVSGYEINVDGTIICNIDKYKLYITLKSNFPDETPIIFTLIGKKYRAQSKGVAMSGNVFSEGFTNSNKIISEGLYRLEITSPIYSVLPTSVKIVFGERNRNLVGSNVKFDPISGNTIELSFNIVIKDGVAIVV